MPHSARLKLLFQFCITPLGNGLKFSNYIFELSLRAFCGNAVMYRFYARLMTLDISPCKKTVQNIFEVRLHTGCSEQAQNSESVDSAYYIHICVLVHKVH